MMLSRILLSFLSFLSLLALGMQTAAASGIHVQCNGCSEAARRQAVSHHGPGSHYVFDLPGNGLYRYDVSCPPVGEERLATERKPGHGSVRSACGERATVSPMAVESEVAEQFALVRRLWLDTNGTFRKNVEVHFNDLNMAWPGTGTYDASAYSVIANFNFRTHVGDHLGMHGFDFTQGLDYLRGLGEYLDQTLGSFLGLTGGIEVTITVVFPDGSKADFVWKYGDDKANYVSNSARTPAGQGIPEDLGPNGAGEWYRHAPGGLEDLERFEHFLRARGIPIVRAAGTRIRCTWNGTTLTCSYI